LLILVVLAAACGTRAAERNYTGNNAYSDGRYEAALRAYQGAQVDAPEDPEGYYNAAAAYFQMSELERAAAALDQALLAADDTLMQSAYYNLGNVYFEMRLYGDAIEVYREALRLNPNDVDARYNLELAIQRYIPPTATAIEQQTNPELGETDPETTPTNEPAGQDGPTPSPPPVDIDPSATPQAGEITGGDQRPNTPIPQQGGPMTIEQAERLLDSILEDQQALSQFLEVPAQSGDVVEKDW
jgi:Ca-activated chloride channel family protein